MSLTSAFKALRKEGYFARQNFWCCQSCGWASVPDGKGDKVVFYHNQDASDLRNNGRCHLAWSGDLDKITKILEENEIKIINKDDLNSETRIYCEPLEGPKPRQKNKRWY